MENRNEHHVETQSYDGPDRRCVLPCAEASTIEAIMKEVKGLRKDLFENNGTEAIIPAIQTRIRDLEKQMVPHDDLHDVVRDYKFGKTILAYLTLCAVVGGAAYVFFHLFVPVTPIPK